LEWIYQSDVKEENKPADFILPPGETLTALLEMAQRGDVEALQEYLANLAQLHKQFTPFVCKLQELHRQFKIDDMLELLEGYLK
jgi:hypothetical protein